LDTAEEDQMKRWPLSSLIAWMLVFAGCGVRGSAASSAKSESSAQAADVSRAPGVVAAQPVRDPLQQMRQRNFRNALAQRHVRHRHSSPR
jgi:hypothetical protein